MGRRGRRRERESRRHASGADSDPRRAAERLTTAFETHDAFTLLSGLNLASSLELRSPRERRSTKLPSFVVEYAHGYAASRPQRAPIAGVGALVSVGALADDAELVASRLLRPLGLRGPIAEAMSKDELDAQTALRIWQLFAHDPGASDAERRRLLEALGPYDSELRSLLGFTSVEADAVIHAFDALTILGLAEVFELDPREPDAMHARLVAQARHGKTLVTLPSELGQRVSFNEDMIGYAASLRLGEELTRNALRAFLGCFSMEFGDVDAERDPARVIWAVRDRPLLRDAEGWHMWTVPYNLVFAVRPVCERILRERGGKVAHTYEKKKGRRLEIESLQILHNGLQADSTWRTLDYATPTNPGERVEGDGLVLVDSVALAVESKTGELSPSAEQGSAKALAKKLEETIIEGAEQGQRTREALTSNVAVSGIDLWTHQRRPIAPERLSRILPIVVVLEPMGAVSAALWRLVKVDTDYWPWVVNVDDLSWFDAHLAMPARLLHYAVVRQRIAAAGRMGALDEADWFWLCFSQGAAAVAEKMATMAILDAQQKVFIGPDVRRGRPLPGRLAQMATEQLLIALHQHRPPGWTEVALALLDLSREADRRLARAVRAVRGRGPKAQRGMWLVERPAVPQGSVLLVGVGDQHALHSELQAQVDSLRDRDDFNNVSRACAVIFDPRDEESVHCDWWRLGAAA